MARVNTSRVPTLTVTVDKETRQLFVEVVNWQGVSPGMLNGLELQVQKAIHAWHLKNMMAAQREEEAKAKEALAVQSGDGGVSPSDTLQ